MVSGPASQSTNTAQARGDGLFILRKTVQSVAQATGEGVHEIPDAPRARRTRRINIARTVVVMVLAL